MLYDNILGTIGRTPIVRINRLAPAGTTMYVKCEFFNPLSSVKDRLAIAIIEDAERNGTLKPGQTVVEATSGNTGIALAMVCAAKGYPFVAVMVETFSIERRKIMRMLGAKVILTPAAGRGQAMVAKAAELAQKHGWFLARQFENEANPAYHRNTTGPEILQDFVGKRLDHFVTGWGTGGTLTGAGQMIKLARPDTKVIVCEPEAAQLLGGKPFTPHKIQGWTPDFVPAVLDRKVADRIVPVADAEAIEAARALAQQRRHLRRHLQRRHVLGGAQGGARSRPGFGHAGHAAGYRRALPVHGLVRRHRRRRRPRAVSGSPRQFEPALRAAAASELAEVSLGAATKFARLPDPFPFWRGGTLTRRPRRLRNLGRAQRGARQRHPAVHRSFALRTRGIFAAGSIAGLVGKDGRRRQGHRHRSLLRHLRQFAGELLRFLGPGLDRPGHRARVSTGFPRPLGGGHRARRLRSRAHARHREALGGGWRFAGWHGGAGIRGAIRRRRAPRDQHLRKPRGLAVCHRAALPAARRHPHRSRVARRPVFGRRAAHHGHAPGAQARHHHLSLGRRMETSLRPPAGIRSPLRSAAAGPCAFPGRIRGAGLPQRAGRQVRIGVRSELLPVPVARHGSFRSVGAWRQSRPRR